MDLTELKCSKKIIARTKISANDSTPSITSFPGCCIKEHLKSSFDSPLLTLLEAWRELCRAMLAWAPKEGSVCQKEKRYKERSDVWKGKEATISYNWSLPERRWKPQSNNGPVCHSLKQAKPRAKNTPRPHTEAIYQRLPAARSKTHRGDEQEADRNDLF